MLKEEYQQLTGFAAAVVNGNDERSYAHANKVYECIDLPKALFCLLWRKLNARLILSLPVIAEEIHCFNADRKEQMKEKWDSVRDLLRAQAELELQYKKAFWVHWVYRNGCALIDCLLSHAKSKKTKVLFSSMRQVFCSLFTVKKGIAKLKGTMEEQSAYARLKKYDKLEKLICDASRVSDAHAKLMLEISLLMLGLCDWHFTADKLCFKLGWPNFIFHSPWACWAPAFQEELQPEEGWKRYDISDYAFCLYWDRKGGEA